VWLVWAAGFGGTTDGKAVLGSNTSNSNVYGNTVVADFRISPFTVAGFARPAANRISVLPIAAAGF
jgi:hypothetical protein